MRGENIVGECLVVVFAGSSPRAWGKLSGFDATAKSTRIIPTCVGKTVRSGQHAGHLPDHPHVRGENFAKAAVSPFVFRIIPTCVGKTNVHALNLLDKTDHPHVRGENGNTTRNAVMLRGSSPRAWGKLIGWLAKAKACRIIPTCVGKTILRARCF